jgi:hypothetical protein
MRTTPRLQGGMLERKGFTPDSLGEVSRLELEARGSTSVATTPAAIRSPRAVTKPPPRRVARPALKVPPVVPVSPPVAIGRLRRDLPVFLGVVVR